MTRTVTTLMTILTIEQQSITKFNDFCIKYLTLEQNCSSITQNNLNYFTKE